MPTGSQQYFSSRGRPFNSVICSVDSCHVSKHFSLKASIRSFLTDFGMTAHPLCKAHLSKTCSKFSASLNSQVIALAHLIFVDIMETHLAAHTILRHMLAPLFWLLNCCFSDRDCTVSISASCRQWAQPVLEFFVLPQLCFEPSDFQEGLGSQTLSFHKRSQQCLLNERSSRGVKERDGRCFLAAEFQGNSP